MRVATLERELTAKAKEGATLLRATGEKCQAENREMTPEERAPIDKISADCKALEARIESARGDEELAAHLDSLSAGLSTRADAEARGLTRVAPSRRMLSLGEQFTQHDGYGFFRNRMHRSSSGWRSPMMELDDPRMHATTITEDPASGGSLLVPQYLPGIIPLLQRPVVVADLLAQGTTTTTAIIYMMEKTFTNAAASVLEGAAKPESALIFESITEVVRKIAHWLPVTDEMLEDVAQIQSYINARLVLGVQLAEDVMLLNGDGVAPNLLGLTKRAGLSPAWVRTDPQNNADAILIQMMNIYQTAYIMPDGIVMNPVNWTGTVLMKTTYGEYITAGPFSPIQSPMLWGLPVAITPAMAADSAFVGAFKSAAQIFRHGGIRVEASNSHQDYFIKNLVAIRAEERLALAVYRPQAFGMVTALTNQSGLLLSAPSRNGGERHLINEGGAGAGENAGHKTKDREKA